MAVCLYIYVCVYGYWQSENACILIYFFCLDGKGSIDIGVLDLGLLVDTLKNEM